MEQIQCRLSLQTPKGYFERKIKKIINGSCVENLFIVKG
jgi:hypothetical protein